MNADDLAVARRSRDAIPLPIDCPFLTFDEAGQYLRISAVALRKAVDGRVDSSEGELGRTIRKWVVRVSAHRRYVLREPFMAWLHEVATQPDTMAS